jgi:hypothetical protein
MPNVARKRLRECRKDGGISALGPSFKERVGSPFGRNRKAAPETTTRAVTDVQLVEANLGKRDRLAAVAMEYMDAVVDCRRSAHRRDRPCRWQYGWARPVEWRCCRRRFVGWPHRQRHARWQCRWRHWRWRPEHWRRYWGWGSRYRW